MWAWTLLPYIRRRNGYVCVSSWDFRWLGFSTPDLSPFYVLLFYYSITESSVYHHEYPSWTPSNCIYTLNVHCSRCTCSIISLPFSWPSASLTLSLVNLKVVCISPETASLTDLSPRLVPTFIFQAVPSIRGTNGSSKRTEERVKDRKTLK